MTKFIFGEWDWEQRGGMRKGGLFCHKKMYRRMSRAEKEHGVFAEQKAAQWSEEYEVANVSRGLVCCFKEPELYSKSNRENEVISNGITPQKAHAGRGCKTLKAGGDHCTNLGRRWEWPEQMP